MTRAIEKKSVRVTTFDVARENKSWRPIVWIGVVKPFGLCLYTRTRIRGFSFFTHRVVKRYV